MQRKKYILFWCLGILILSVLFKPWKIFSLSNANQKTHQAFIVTNQYLKKGEYLSMDNTKVEFLDLGKGSKQFVRNAEFESYDGLQLREDIAPYLPVLKKNLMLHATTQENIPTGKRLFVLDMPVGPIVSVLKTNDVIDVIAQIDMPSLGNVTETILEAVKIVAIGNSDTDESESENQFLSFYLTPDEVKIISFMKPYSNFSVVLRNPNDIVHTNEHAVTFNSFLQNKKIQKIMESDSFKMINGRNIKSFNQKLDPAGSPQSDRK